MNGHGCAKLPLAERLRCSCGVIRSLKVNCIQAQQGHARAWSYACGEPHLKQAGSTCLGVYCTPGGGIPLMAFATYTPPEDQTEERITAATLAAAAPHIMHAAAAGQVCNEAARPTASNFVFGRISGNVTSKVLPPRTTRGSHFHKFGQNKKTVPAAWIEWQALQTQVRVVCEHPGIIHSGQRQTRHTHMSGYPHTTCPVM